MLIACICEWEHCSADSSGISRTSTMSLACGTGASRGIRLLSCFAQRTLRLGSSFVALACGKSVSHRSIRGTLVAVSASIPVIKCPQNKT
jgi:hypothetical protein